MNFNDDFYRIDFKENRVQVNLRKKSHQDKLNERKKKLKTK